VERNTLLLRLLGAGAVLKKAIAELQELPADQPERKLALPILINLRLAVPTDPALQTSNDKEFLMDTLDLAEAWRRELIQEGVKQGLVEGVKQGLVEGVKQGLEEGVKQGREGGVACSLMDVYEARFDAMPKDLRAIVESTHDEDTLRGWLRLAGTRDASEVAAAIRGFQVALSG
jgi:flagellar biosynthesis/type III secretory pathway protein FliH